MACRAALTLCFSLFALAGVCQSTGGDRYLLVDSLDHKFDFSDFLIVKPRGFIPVPIIVTEPALGNFGLGVAPVFLKKRPSTTYKRNGVVKKMRTRPDVSGGALLYTANQTWAAFVFRSATWLKTGIHYRAGGGFANLNLDFYRNNISGAETRYGFNFKTIPLIGTFLKILPGTPWSGGLKYTFLRTELSARSGVMPAFVESKEINSTLSMPGLVIEYDNRDNIFTPDKGFRFHASMAWSDKAVGSDWNYSNLDVYSYYYHPLSHRVIGALRVESQQVFGETPFYLLPYISLRGLPVARYQGNIYSVAETEVRWDVVQRWSAVFFAGSGKAYNNWNEFSSSSWISSGGAGFRYLAARKFKLRVGLDLARGPEQWAYYIVFGTSWAR